MPISITVKELANGDIISLDKEKSVWDVVQLMSERNIGAVVITDSGTPTGIVTERDVLKKIVLKGMDSRSVKSGEIMSAPLITIQSGASLGEATQLMIDKRIRRLLVVDGGKIIGIFTERDLQRRTFDAFIWLSQAT